MNIRIKFPIDRATEVAVGWDEKLQSYFGVIYTKNEAGLRRKTILSVGTRLGDRIDDVDELQSLLFPHVIPDRVGRKLREAVE